MMDITPVHFDKIPLIVIDRGRGYVSLPSCLGEVELFRFEKQVYDSLVKAGRIRAIE